METNTAAPKRASLRETVLEGEMLSADLVPVWGRPQSGGKKRLNALPEQPGYGFWHPGRDSQR